MDEASASCGQRLSFENITEANVHHLRKMNASVFPVRYHDKFYADIVRGDPNFNQFGESKDHNSPTAGTSFVRSFFTISKSNDSRREVRSYYHQSILQQQ